MSVKVNQLQVEGGAFKRPAATMRKFPFRRGVHDFRLFSCFIPSRRRFRDKLFLLPSDSSAPGSPSSDGASLIDDVDDDEFFSDEDDKAQLLTTDSSSSSLGSTLKTTASTTSTTLPNSADDCTKSPPLSHDQSTSQMQQLTTATGAMSSTTVVQEATEESFVFSPPALLADNGVARTPSFRTLSDPLLSTFSYDCSGDALAITAPIKSSLTLSWNSVTSRSSPPLLAHSRGGRHGLQPLPPAAVTRNIAPAPHQTRAVWLPLPALPPDVATQSGCGVGHSHDSAIPSELRFNPTTAGSSLSMSASSSAMGSEKRGIHSSTVSRSSTRQGQSMAPASVLGGLPLPTPSVATQLFPGLHAFEFEELRDATQSFAPECCLEKGAFGAVYRAWVKPPSCVSNQEFQDPMKPTVEVAVLRLAANKKQHTQTSKVWKSAVQMLAQLPANRNIGVIQGYCALEDTVVSEKNERRSGVERLLVFELSPCGTLHDYLFGRSHFQTNTTLQAQRQLDWALRISIVLGAARGLLYIHDRAPVQILYRDFKAASVLILDQDHHTPRLAGYGLAVTSWPSTADNKSSFSMVMAISKAHAKANVWSFGIVLVEILTGKHSRDASSALYCDERSFVQWAVPFLKDEAKLVHILDPRLKATQCPAKAALNLARLALQCLKKKPEQRPSMARVVDTLKTLAPESVARVDRQISKSQTRTFGGISFSDAEHRSKFVGQYFSVQGANNSGGLDRDSSRSPCAAAALPTGVNVALEMDKRPKP